MILQIIYDNFHEFLTSHQHHFFYFQSEYKQKIYNQLNSNHQNQGKHKILMPSHFDEDSQVSRNIIKEDWFDEVTPVHMAVFQHIEKERHQMMIEEFYYSPQQIYESDEWISNPGLRSSPEETVNSNNTNEGETRKQDSQPQKKKKKIQKSKNKEDQRKKDKNPMPKKSVNSPKASPGNKSKYNNMGGFLIGSFSDIINERAKGWRFKEGSFQILIQDQWVQIEKGINTSQEQDYEKILLRLKKKLHNMPRKEGSKKDLFKLMNNDEGDSPNQKTAKSLIRRQISYSLSDNAWLSTHVQSKEFKPEKDDQEGTKKRERHNAYEVYLLAIKSALHQGGQLPKRLNL